MEKNLTETSRAEAGRARPFDLGIFIPNRVSVVRLLYAEILHVRSARKCCVVYMTNGKRIEAPCSLQAMEKCLPSCWFRRIHRTCIVNLGHVTAIVNSTVKVGDQLLPVSRTLKDEIFALFNIVGRGEAPEEPAAPE